MVLMILCNLLALNKMMCPKSVSSGSVSVANDPSSESLACGNFSKGGAFIRLHCVATLLWLA